MHNSFDWCHKPAAKQVAWAAAALGLLLCGTSQSRAAFLFLDTYNTTQNSNDVNYQNAMRQSGTVAPLTYNEEAQTAGGGNPWATQVNNDGVPNTLLLANRLSAGQNFTWVSPNHNFTDQNQLQIQVQIDPLGPGSEGSTDHWAALVFGSSTQGIFINSGTDTGVLLRDGGAYSLFNDGTAPIQSGNVGPKPAGSSFYTVDFDVNLATGMYSLYIDGNHIYSGSHGGAYAANYVTLEDNSGNTSGLGSGNQVDYFDNLSVAAVPEPASLTLLGVGFAGLMGYAGLRRRKKAAPAA